MSKIKNVLIIGFCGLVFSGCASKYPITYDSTPSGAMVVCDGNNMGYAPTTLYYKPSEENKQSGSMKTISCTANWVSGARAEYSDVWDLNKFPGGVRQTLPRPNVTGYEKDAQFALQIQSMKNQQQQAEAAAFSQSLQNMNNTVQNMNYNMQMQQLNNNLMGMRYGY